MVNRDDSVKLILIEKGINRFDFVVRVLELIALKAEVGHN